MRALGVACLLCCVHIAAQKHSNERSIECHFVLFLCSAMNGDVLGARRVVLMRVHATPAMQNSSRTFVSLRLGRAPCTHHQPVPPLHRDHHLTLLYLVAAAGLGKFWFCASGFTAFQENMW